MVSMSTGERGAVRKKGATPNTTSSSTTTTSSSNATTTTSTSSAAAASTNTVVTTTIKNGQSTTGIGATPEETPNHIVYRKMEALVERMQHEHRGVPVRTVKSFMSKIPSVFTGVELISWMLRNLDIEDPAEALHLAHLMSAHGYFFPIDDHILTAKNDNTFFRFQTPYFWPSNCWEPENTDYAVYLCKRTMQNKARLELADYEAENLARLQKMFSRKWEFIFMQAEAQSKVDKKRDKLERKVLDSQERAFWDVHRPVPGCVNTTEIDIKKACRMNKPIKSSKHLALGVPGGRLSPSVSEADINNPRDRLRAQVGILNTKIDRCTFKVSKAAESYLNFFEQYHEYDPQLYVSEPPNPWISDCLDYWEMDKLPREIPSRRVRRWGFSVHELLRDPLGRDQFTKFLEKEFSAENLMFLTAVQELKALPQKDVDAKVQAIWDEFLSSDASAPVNIDSKSMNTTRKNMEHPDRWTFDEAAAHLYQLMRTDSYCRYLRSDLYKDFLSGTKKKTSVKGIRSIVAFSGKPKENVKDATPIS